MTSRRRHPTALLAASLAVSAACGDVPAPPAEEVAYIAVSTVFNGDEALSYVTPLPSLAAEQDVDYLRSIEKGAIPRLYTDPEPTARFVLGEGQEPTLARFDVEGGRMVPGARLSLANLGVSSFDNAGYLLSDDKAYYYDHATLQVIVWNPATMEILSTIDVGGVERANVTAYFAYSPPGLVGTNLFFLLQYYTGEPDYFPADGSVLVVIDTTTDTLANIDVDDRCDALANWVRTDDGTVWFASGMASIQNRVFELGLETECMLKLAPDGRSFDDGFFVNLGTVIDSPVIGTMVQAGPGEVYVKALDQDVLALDAVGDVSELFAPVYRYWRIDLATMTATRDDRLPLTGSGGYFFAVGGQTYADQSAEDFSDTTLWHMNAPGGPTPGVTLRGYVYGLGEVR
jgi:hypothetical protein